MATAGDPGLMGSHASTLAWLSSAHEHAGDLPAAASARAENVAILTALKQADPANAVWSQDLAVALNFQMQLAQQLGRDDEALALVRRSCTMMDEDRRRDLQNREYQRGHAVCQSMLAGALLMAGQFADARAAAVASVAALDTLVSEAGAQSDWPMQALAARLRLAEVEAADGQCATALAALEAIEQHPDAGSPTTPAAHSPAPAAGSLPCAAGRRQGGTHDVCAGGGRTRPTRRRCACHRSGLCRDRGDRHARYRAPGAGARPSARAGLPRHAGA